MFRVRLASSSIVLVLFFAVVFFACNQTNTSPASNNDSASFTLVYPFGFDSLHLPPDNALSQTRIDLGKKIFFDTRFSADKKISCASCHKPEFAFADTVSIHKGAHDSTNFRNTPSLINIGYHPYFDYDGGVPTLELQVLVPFDGPTEMNSNLLKAAELMNLDAQYVELSQKAYNRKPDPYIIVRALASYQRALISKGSRYDAYKANKKSTVFTAEEKRGEALFNSTKLNCVTCHKGVLLTDFKFHNIGIPNVTQDSGRCRVTNNPLDYGKFKTPSLRNVALTPPYMHDGSLKTLEDVLDFYANGGINKRNQSALIHRFTLTPDEKKAIVAFLHTLTDTL